MNSTEASVAEKRKLSQDEIEDILSTIIPDEWQHIFKHRFHVKQLQSNHSLPASYEYVIRNNHHNIERQLKDIEIYPECIPELKQMIQRHFHASRVQPGEMVGMIAASSIGEQFTQSSLNR